MERESPFWAGGPHLHILSLTLRDASLIAQSLFLRPSMTCVVSAWISFLIEMPNLSFKLVPFQQKGWNRLAAVFTLLGSYWVPCLKTQIPWLLPEGLWFLRAGEILGIWDLDLGRQLKRIWLASQACQCVQGLLLQSSRSLSSKSVFHTWERQSSGVAGRGFA